MRDARMQNLKLGNWMGDSVSHASRFTPHAGHYFHRAKKAKSEAAASPLKLPPENYLAAGAAAFSSFSFTSVAPLPMRLRK
jgi:hypothetical protein